VWVLNTTDDLLKHPEQVTWTVCTMTANFAICFLGWWRCFANNYLHWAAGTTWLLLIAQGTITLSLCLVSLSLSIHFILSLHSAPCFFLSFF
jgi:adenylate cyclase 8